MDFGEKCTIVKVWEEGGGGVWGEHVVYSKNWGEISRLYQSLQVGYKKLTTNGEVCPIYGL